MGGILNRTALRMFYLSNFVERERGRGRGKERERERQRERLIERVTFSLGKYLEVNLLGHRVGTCLIF